MRDPNLPVEIKSDGITVWVNQACMLGRFGRFGIDIHKPLEEQMNGGECLYCTHSETTKEDWEAFKTKMLELHDIKVSDRYMPRRFKTHLRLVSSTRPE